MPPNNSPIDSLSLEQAIDRHPLIVAPETLVRDVIALMSETRACRGVFKSDSETEGFIFPFDRNLSPQIRSLCILVMTDSQLMGVFTETDVLQMAASGKNIEGVIVAEVMTRQVITLKTSECKDVLSVLNLFRQHQIRHLPVVDEQNQLVGLLTLDFLKMYGVLEGLQRKVSQLEAEKAELLQSRNAQLKQPVTARTTQLRGQAERDRLLAQVALRIRQSLNLDDILNSTVTEVRQFLQADRVLVYQFAPNWDGSIMAESVAQGWSVSLGTQIEDTCFRAKQGGEYRQGRKRAIADIYQAGLTDCHVRLLERFQVKANLVVPILMAEQLWGLLVVHQCTGFRQWQELELDLLEQLAVQIAIAIQQAKAFEQIQTELVERLRVEKALQQLAGELELRVQNRTVALANAITSLRLANGQLQQEISEREQAQKELLVGKERLQYLLSSSPTVIYSCKPEWDYQATFVSDNLSTLLGYETEKSVLEGFRFWIKLLHPEDAPYLFVQLLSSVKDDEKKTVEFRFLHKNGTYRWIQNNFRLVRDAVGNPLEIVGSLVDVTDQKLVEEALRQQLEREHLIVEIAQRIRESLDLEAILHTTVAQVQQLLLADRVLVYRINSDGTGCAIAEAVAPSWSKVLDITFPEEVFPKECYDSYIKGRVYTLCNREQSEVLPCLAKFLQQIEVKAKLVVPIIQKETLWGLLIAHQCSQPRQWQTWESSLLQQLATQLAIAIQQSELYQQLQVQLRDRQKAEEQITASLAEKELLLKEVHHRVKNNLQVISSLFSLQSQSVEDSQILSIIADSQNRIGAMALIHEKLYQSDSLTKIDFTDYIQNLANNLFASYNISPNLIYLNLRVSDVSLNLDTAIPCGLLISELVSNSLKHAFPDKQVGEIIIDFSVNSEGFLSLLVRDNGVGLPLGLHYKTTNSLGLRLIRALTRQLRGKLEVENDNGAIFHITFPSPQERQRF